MNHLLQKSIIVLILSLSIYFPYLHAQKASPEIEAQIDALFSSYQRTDFPGASIAVMQNGELLFSKGYGAANLEYNIPITPTTIFHVASVSKQFTVFAILLLAEEGKLSLEDDIRMHIPEVPDFGHRITLRHLASHTSGMRDQWNLLSMAGWRMDDVITKAHILTLVSRQKELNFLPGEAYYYCNTGFTLLAEVVARKSGMSFAEFTKKYIFEPIGMKNTLFYDDHEKIVKNRAYSYYQENGKLKKSVLSFANAGATSLFTTAEDLCLWADQLNGTPKVGSKAIVTQMNTPAKLNDGSTFGGALGQFVETYKGLLHIQHGGSDAGYRSYLGRFPEQQLSVAVASNYAWFNPNQMALQVADIFLKDEIVTTDETTNTVTDITAQPSAKKLKAYEANYWNEEERYGRRIYLKNDTLRYSRGNSESPLVPIGGNKFQMLGVDVELIVEFTDDNKMVVVIDDGTPIVSKKYEPKQYMAKELTVFTGTFYSEELATSYELLVENNQLIMRHLRQGDTPINSIKKDTFISRNWYLGNIDFVRDEKDAITGLRVTNGRVRNLWFEKVE
ncbi:MAG: serine hydrolase domain-containing protein [Bacteroidota bacterium]